MVLSVSIFIVLVFMTFKKFEETFVAAMLLSPWLYHFSLWGGDIYSYYCIITLFVYIRKYTIYKNYSNDNPLRVALPIFAISIFITGLFMGVPRPMSVVTMIIRDVANIYIMWGVLNRTGSRSISVFYNVGTIWVFVFTLYTVYEFITGDNPYIDLINSMGVYKTDTLVTDMRYGFKRCQSLFSMHTTLGGVGVYTIVPLIWISLKRSATNGSKLMPFLLAGSLLFVCVASGARSAMFGAVICMGVFLDTRYLSIKYLLPAAIVFLFLYDYLFAEVMSDIINSFTDTESVGGSNSEMREGQFAIGFMYLAKSWLFGNGLYAWIDVSQVTDLYGAESMWLGLMIDRGLLGLVSAALYVLCEVRYVIKENSLVLVLYILGIVAFNSMSSIPNVDFTYYIFPIVIMILSNESRINNIFDSRRL